MISGERGKGEICINGAAAHLMKPGDPVILATECELSDEVARTHRPKVIRVDEQNRIVGDEPEIAGPNPPLWFLEQWPRCLEAQPAISTPAELDERRERTFLLFAAIFLGTLTMLNILGISLCRPLLFDWWSRDSIHKSLLVSCPIR